MGSLLHSRSSRVNQPQIQYPDTGLRIQTAVMGRVRPIGWGRVRAAGNVILANSFQAVATPSVDSSGNVSYSYTYEADVIVALGNSVVNGIVNIWNGTESGMVLFNGPNQPNLSLNPLNTVANPNGMGGGLLFHGSYTQTQWTYKGALSAGNLAYRGEAYLAFAKLNMGSSTTIPNFTFEFDYGIGFDLPAVCPDANPADVITDYLTNADYGVPQFLSSYLADMTDFRRYCRAFSLLVSFTETNQRPASDMLQELARVLNVDFVWSSGKLKVVPYTPFPGTQNGYFWNPQTTPVYAFNDTHYLENSGSLGSVSSTAPTPVAIARKPRSLAVNHTKLEYLPRGAYYNPWILDYIDEGSVANWGVEIIGDVIQAHHFCYDAAAQSALHLLASRNQVIRTFQFTVGRRFILLDPMDLVTITDATSGLNNQPALVKEIRENADGTLTVTAEEYLALVGPPIFGFSNITAITSALNIGGPPGDVNPPIIFEPPDQLGKGLWLYVAVSGQNQVLWGGCEIWASFDQISYAQIGQVFAPAQMGVLTATLPSVSAAISGQTIDATHTLSVNLAESNGALLPASPQDFASLATLCLVDGELLAYENAALVSGNSYNLSPLSRGCYGSNIANHAIGAPFTLVDGSLFHYHFTQDKIGQTIYLKFLSFNVFGQGLEQLANVGAYSYVIQGTALGSPLPTVQNLRTVFNAGVTQLFWDEITDFRPVQYLVKKGGSWASALPVATLAHPPFVVTGDDTYWVSAVSQPTSGLTVYSASPTSLTVAGSFITQNVILYFDEDGKQANTAYWPGAKSNVQPDSIGLRLDTTGNILSDTSILATTDIINYGSTGIQSSGSYTSNTIVNAGRLTQMLVQANWVAVGLPIGAASNILAQPNILSQPDVLNFANTAFVNVYPQIRVGTWNGGGITWGTWQKYQAGVYQGQYVQMQLILLTVDPNTIAYCTDFDWTVSLAPRVDHYLNQTIPAGGLTITFRPDALAGQSQQSAAPFNGGPNAGNLPGILATWQNNAGDQLVITNLSLSSVTIQIQNGGVGVTTYNANVVAEGY